MSILDMIQSASPDEYSLDSSSESSGTESPPNESEHLLRSVTEPDVSLDEMLSLACRQGKLDIVQLLLQSGAHINHRNKAGNTPLLEACSQGHVDVANYLLENGSLIDAPTETTLDSALTWACTLGNQAIVDALLIKKADVEHRTKDGCTALMFACLAGHKEVAEKLLDAKSEINVESDSNKDSPLTFACWKGHANVVELLLKRNANIEHRTKEGFSPLMFAALGGHTDVARKLLERQAQVNVPSGSNNDIPLTSACWKGHHDVVKLLLECGSNIEHHTKDGCTPLMLAAREGHINVARLLLGNKAEVNVPSGSENNIPLTLACWKGHCDVVQLLLDNHSDIEHHNKAGCTPLMLAAREGHYDTTKLLLERGAQVNIPSGSNDDTPLTLACWKGHQDVVELLLEYKSNLDHQTKTGCTPLMEATREGHKDVAEILLNHNADVELPDNYGQSPLFMACWKGHHAVGELLLQRGAHRDCRTKTGITPLFQACRENHVAIVELLLDYGAGVNNPFPNSRENPMTLSAEKGHKALVELLLARGGTHDCRTKKGCTPVFLACKEGHFDIASRLCNEGANIEIPDCRGTTPIMAAFKNGHVAIVEWLVNRVHHLPSDELCHKILMSSVDEEEKEVALQKRSKCLTIIQEVKKKREQLALRNAQILVKELDDERNREESKKKKQAAKRRDKRNKRKKNKEAETADKAGMADGNESVLLEGAGNDCDEQNEEDEDNDDDEFKDSAVPTENRDGGSGDDLIVETHPALASKFDSVPLEEKDSICVAIAKQSCRKANGDCLPVVVPSEEKSEKTLKSLPTIDLGATKSELLQKLGNRSRPFVCSDKNGLRPGLSLSQKVASAIAMESFVSSQGTSDVQPCTKRTESQHLQSADQSLSLSEPVEFKQVGQVEDIVDGLVKQFSDAALSTVHSNKQRKDFSPIRVPPKTSGISTQSSSTQGPSRVPSSSLKSSSKKSKKQRGFDLSQPPPLLPVVTSVAVTTAGTYITTMSDPRTDVSNITPSFASTDEWEEAFREKEDVFIEPTRGEPNHKPAPVTSNCLQKDGSYDEFREMDWQEVIRNSRTAVFEMVVPNAYCGRVIGKAGRKINQITEETGAQITVEKPTTSIVPTKRLIRIRGAPCAADRARSLVTKALNTPSFNKDSTDSAGDAATKQAPCGSDAPSAITVPASAVPTPRAAAAGLNVENGAPSSVGSKSSTSDVSIQPLITPSIPHGLLPYSKVATGQITLEDVHKHLVRQQQVVQPRSVPSFGTPAIPMPSCQEVSDDRPINSDSAVSGENSKYGIIGDCRSKNNSKETSPSNQTSVSSASEASKTSDFASKGFSYFSPWPVQSPGQKISHPSNIIMENHVPLQGISAFVESTKVGTDLPTYPWQQNATAMDRSRSVSWTDRTKECGLAISDVDSASDPGSHSISADAVTADRRNVVVSPWNASPGKAAETAEELVFVEDLTWTGKVSSVSSEVLAPSAGDGWELSSSPTSSVSSSKVELANILDSECVMESARPWAASSEHGGSEVLQDSPFQDASSHSSCWLQSRGAYSAPSSPALQRNEKGASPVSQNHQPHIRAHPSMEELHVSRPWLKARPPSKVGEQASWSSCRDTPSFSSRRLSGGGLKAESSSMSRDNDVVSPRVRRPESEAVGVCSSGGSQWTADRFHDVASVADLLLQLSLDKYASKFEEQCITLEVLVNLSEGNLQSIGIPKGPRLKILKACELLKGRGSSGHSHMQSTLAISAQTFVSSLSGFQSHLQAQHHYQQASLPVIHQTAAPSLHTQHAQHMLTQAASHQAMSAFQPFQHFPMPPQSFGMVVPSDGLPQSTYLAQTLPQVYSPSGSEFMNHLPIGRPSVGGGLHPGSNLHSVTTLSGDQPHLQMLFQEPTGFYFYPSS